MACAVPHAPARPRRRADDPARDYGEAWADALSAAARASTAAPVTTLPIHAIDSDGALAAALDPRPGDAWIIRPDAHIAAVLPRADAPGVAGALRTALAQERSTRPTG